VQPSTLRRSPVVVVETEQRAEKVYDAAKNGDWSETRAQLVPLAQSAADNRTLEAKAPHIVVMDETITHAWTVKVAKVAEDL
jgi:hypothetical protein